MGRPLVANRDTALAVGLALWLAGSVLLWDAWENRARKRPFAMRLVGLFP
ncbi:MAG TPA: hypothetical protein VGX21_13275 [Methylomirabilota bacterium]|jgi:hypothetical protein|nr:hypothetical protein [Methylomirabilota bacterium]